MTSSNDINSVNSKFTMYNWVFGIVITLQLLTFSWLGYLSTTVVGLQIDYTSTKLVLIEKLSAVNKSQDKLEDSLEKISDKIDDLKKQKGTTHGER